MYKICDKRLRKFLMVVIYFVFITLPGFSNNSNTNGITSLKVAFWNVENLFDTIVNGPAKHKDDSFTPKSWRRWTEERYSQKLTNLAWVIDKMKPDVLCMAEVENGDVLEDLNKRLEENHGWKLPYIAHIDSSDPRGIDQAVMSKYPVLSSHLVAMTYGRRGVLVAMLNVDDSPVTFMVNHWKSAIGDKDENMAIRAMEAMALKAELKKRYLRNPEMSFVVAGDFNEEMDDPTMMTVLKALINRDAALKEGKAYAKNAKKYSEEDSYVDLPLYNLIADIPNHKDRGSYYYARRKIWNTFDTILVTGTMLLPESDKKGPEWRVLDKTATKIFKLPEMQVDDDGRPKAFRRVRISGKPDNYYEEGYSDHFPVITELQRIKK